MSYGIGLVILGILGASNLIIARRPDASAMISRMAPYQGWLGAGSVLWGIANTINAILNIGYMSVDFIDWVLWLAAGIVQALLGLLLGVGVLKTFIKDATAQQKMDETITKLSPFQGIFGLVAIGLGLATIVWAIIG